MYGPDIIARSMTAAVVTDKHGRKWQYHRQSDLHSKIACCAVLFDLLNTSSLMQSHVAAGKVAFALNRRINDFQSGRKKNLDLVVARADGGKGKGSNKAVSLAELIAKYQVVLTPAEAAVLNALPTSPASASGSTVLAALEAKACMTAHVRALPRLYDELTSSHDTVHGDNENALAVGFVMVNTSDTFISSSLQHPGQPDEVSRHTQPHVTNRTMDKIREIKRRSGPGRGAEGFDALGVLMVNMKNDGSPVALVTAPPAPPASDDYNYDRMIVRAAHLYDSAFRHV